MLPNEMRISSGGDVAAYGRVASKILGEMGYANVKMVGRGQAVALTQELVDYMKEKISNCFFQVRFTTSFNKRGDVVDEIHVMISKKAVEGTQYPHSKGDNFQSRNH